MTKTSLVRDSKELFSILTQPGGDVHYIEAINEEVVSVDLR